MAEIIYSESFEVRKPAVNLKPGDEVFFKNAENRKIEAVDLLRLKNVYVLINYLFNPWKLKFYMKYTHWVDMPMKDKLRRLLMLRKKKLHVDKGLWVTSLWSEGYFHWITDVLPRIIVAEKYTNGHKLVLSDIHRPFKYISDSMQMLGVECIYYDRYQPVLVKELLVPGVTGPTGNYNHKLMREVRQRLAGHLSQREAYRKIFISRKHAPTRRILNDEKMEAVLKENGFEIHYFEQYDLKKQIELMSETKYLAGVHGAGLTNMLFMKEGGSVLELRNSGDAHNNCYFSLATAMGLDYYYQMNKGTNAVTQQADIEVDIEELRRNVNNMIAT